MLDYMFMTYHVCDVKDTSETVTMLTNGAPVRGAFCSCRVHIDVSVICCTAEVSVACAEEMPLEPWPTTVN